MTLGKAIRAAAVLPATLIIVCGCSGSGGGGIPDTGTVPAPALNTPAAPSTPAAPVKLFRDVTGASGLDFSRQFPPDHHMANVTYGGIAVGDFNGNGLLDLFVTRGDLAPNLLYMNLGNLTFVDVAAQAGLAFTKSYTENYKHSGPVFADMNGNGYPDLFIGGISGDPSLIFRNNGDGTFTNVTAGSGLDTMTSRNTVSASLGDYDLDGRPDLFLTHWGTLYDFGDIGDTEHLWRNVSEGGDIRFVSVSVEAGIAPGILTEPLRADGAFSDGDWTFTSTFARLTDSPFPDLLIAADYRTSRVFRNNGDGTFTNVTDPAVITDEFGMGAAVGDFTGSGRLDWFVTSIYAPPGAQPMGGYMHTRPTGNRMYRNTGGEFIDVTVGSGTVDGGWGWGACVADFQNNGHLDIVHTNGWPFQHTYGNNRRDPIRLFIGDGSGAFSEQAQESGLADETDGRAVVCADFNNNGHTDVLLLHRNPTRSVTLWENTGTSNNWLRVSLRGLAPNTEASGARLRARIGDRSQMREITIGGNYISQVSPVQHFGLGSASSVDELIVEWPDTDTPPTILTHVAANQTLTLEHPAQ